jgi:hypothetical protein
LSARAATNSAVAYNLNTDWTNVEAAVWDVSGTPRTPAGGFPAITQSGSVTTDGSGKISGIGTIEITYDATGVPFSRFVVDTTGHISSSPTKTTPVVTLNIKGTGFTTDASGFSVPARLSLSFKGQPGPNPSNPNQTRIVGVLNGTITGPTPLSQNTAKLNGLVAYIPNSAANSAGFFVWILQQGKGMTVLDTDWTGRGSITTTNAYRMSANGQGFSRGSSLAFSGVLGPHTDQNSQGTPITFTAPVTANGKGKVSGQAVSLTNAVISANLIAN